MKSYLHCYFHHLHFHLNRARTHSMSQSLPDSTIQALVLEGSETSFAEALASFLCFLLTADLEVIAFEALVDVVVLYECHLGRELKVD